MIQEHSEDQARRAARRVGLKAHKSRWHVGTTDNRGGFQIIDPRQTWVRPNGVVAGQKFDFTADDVIAFCARYEGDQIEASYRSS